EAAVRALCDAAREDEVLSPANFNSPGQIVIAGHQTAIERAVALGKERSLKAIPLKVSAPFHCALMQPAAARVRAALADVRVSRPRFPVVANVDARPHDDPSEIADLLVRQVDSAVLWEQSVLAMTAAGVGRALELGPGKVLAGLVKRIDKSWSVQNVSSTEEFASAQQLARG
ncbi:MAG TPA: ACP S-malonyltransferase, partial [Polyangiaceae bacterium]|nr:ACP S-malonyltransferase [Polyangiaceae bacterium]